MSVLSSWSTIFVGLDDVLDTLVAPWPLLDDVVLGGVASRWHMLTGINGIGEGGVIMVRVFSSGGRHGGMDSGGIISLLWALATAATAVWSQSFHQLWAWSPKSVCFCCLSL